VAGDTLGSIAARFGTSVAALASINHISNPNLIFAGEVLTISGTRAGTPAPSSPSRSAPAPAPAPADPRPSAPASAAATAVRVALAQVGKPYLYGGAGPSSFDCSGLVMYAWEHAGVSLPHYSVAQYADTERIAAYQLEPGDLVFYNNGFGAQPGHVTIYIGGGRVVTADQPGTVVRVEAVDWDGRPMGYGRVR
jgi:cell wall-associated NlpC family hydrolase